MSALEILIMGIGRDEAGASRRVNEWRYSVPFDRSHSWVGSRPPRPAIRKTIWVQEPQAPNAGGGML